MFNGGPWKVRSQTNANYSLDCTPERLEGDKWCPQIAIYRDEAEVVHTIAPRTIVFDTADEAAEFARICGERWLAQHNPA
jgi:hypothetical protein